MYLFRVEHQGMNTFKHFSAQRRDAAMRVDLPFLVLLLCAARWTLFRSEQGIA
jgi:hypothetical protein